MEFRDDTDEDEDDATSQSSYIGNDMAIKGQKGTGYKSHHHGYGSHNPKSKSLDRTSGMVALTGSGVPGARPNALAAKTGNSNG